MNRPEFDFDELAKLAFPDVNELGPIDALDLLWSSLFKLEKWYFLAKPPSPDSTDQPEPYQWDRKQDGKLCLLVFTDVERAKRFSAEQDLADDNGVIPFVSMTPKAALTYMEQLDGSSVAGIRFNEGSYCGWAAPLSDIRAIYGHLFPGEK